MVEELRTKEYMTSRREKSLRMLDRLQEEAAHVKDTPGITRKVVHVGPMSVTTIGFGHANDEARVDEVHFRKALLMCSGSAKIVFDNGDVMEISEKRDLLAIPPGIPYTVTALEDDTAVIIKMSES